MQITDRTYSFRRAMRFCFMREWMNIDYRYMQVHDFKRVKELKKLTGFPEFWIAARYWELIDSNVGKTDEQLAELLVKQNEEQEKQLEQKLNDIAMGDY